MQPVPMSGQTGMPQTAIWSIADAIMSQTYGDEIDIDYQDEEDDDVPDEPRIAKWSTWNTPRYDVERFYQKGGGGMSDAFIRGFVRDVLTEAGKQYFHGGPLRLRNGQAGQPVFLGMSPEDVRFYATSHGQHEGGVISVVESTHTNAANYEALLQAASAVGATPDAVEEHADFQSETDFIYIPEVQEKLEEMGYDAYSDYDVLGNTEIPILVLWDATKYSVVDEIDVVVEGHKVHVRGRGGQFAVAEGPQAQYIEGMRGSDERMLRRYIRAMIEANAISTGGASGVESGQIRGVVTPLGTGPKHPRKSDKRGAKKRTKKRLEVGADAFGGGRFAT